MTGFKTYFAVQTARRIQVVVADAATLHWGGLCKGACPMNVIARSENLDLLFRVRV
jgi:hypothetical protein